MNLADVMSEIGDALDSISGLRVARAPAGSIQAPAAVVGLPDELAFDQTYGRGTDRLKVPVVVAVGRPQERTTVERLGRYADGSGAESVKQVLEGWAWTTCDFVHVVSVAFDVVRIGGTDYAGALFTLDVVGDGA